MFYVPLCMNCFSLVKMVNITTHTVKRRSHIQKTKKVDCPAKVFIHYIRR
ncbi:UNVERIFIED_CONTAM: hypothetical protein FKN15_062538 [Acipenser sinensis]